MTRCNIITTFNHKGGVGKTTTAVNLGASLAAVHGKRTLLLDLDPQANATRAVLKKELAESHQTIRSLFSPDTVQCPLTDLSIPTSVQGLDVVPSELKLSEVEFKMAARRGRECILREALRTATSRYDYIIIDCPPSLGLLSLNGLVAAEYVVIPCETQYLSIRGIRQVIEIIEIVRETLSPRLQILGVFPTKYFILSKANVEALQYLRTNAKVRVFDAVLPRDVRAEEAPSHGLPLVAYAPDSRAARAFGMLTSEVLRLCGD